MRGILAAGCALVIVLVACGPIPVAAEDPAQSAILRASWARVSGQVTLAESIRSIEARGDMGVARTNLDRAVLLRGSGIGICETLYRAIISAPDDLRVTGAEVYDAADALAYYRYSHMSACAYHVDGASSAFRPANPTAAVPTPTLRVVFVGTPPR